MANGIDMDRGWLVARGGQQFGPYTWEQLVEAALQGRVAPEDLVWHPSVTAWEPASEVPGLLSAAEDAAVQADYATSDGRSGAATAPRGRRRTWIVAASVLAIVMVALAATLALVLTRNRDKPPDLILHEIQDMTVQGTVTLPPGTSLGPSDLRVLSNRADTTLAIDGAFSLTAAAFPSAETLVVAVGPGGNPLLMGAGSAVGETPVSALSTARALVLHDPAILGLPPELAAEAERLATLGPGLAELAVMVEESVRADPSDPLNADTHPELYQKAARLTADALAPLMETQPQPAEAFPAARGPRQLASTGLLLADTSGGFVAVEDDPEHTSPYVFLVNHTFAYYDVEWTCQLDKKTTAGRVVLARCRPYNVEGLQIDWLPLAFIKTRALPVGDGRLTFSFKKSVKWTGIDAVVTLMGTLGGFGAGKAGLMLSELDSGAASAADAVINSSRAIAEFIELFERASGTITYSEAFWEVAGFLTINGYRLTMAMVDLMYPEKMNEKYIEILGLTIAKKPVQLALLGYGSVDVAAMLVDGRNPALDSYSTGGMQVAGIYPFDVTMNAELLGLQDGVYAFQATIGSLPYDMPGKLQLVFSYGDGKKDAVAPSVESGSVPVTMTHRYQKVGSYQVKVELTTIGKDRFVLASQTIPLDVEVAGDAASGSDPLAAPFPNGFVQTGKPKDSSRGWTYRGVVLQREGTVQGMFTNYPSNPLAYLGEHHDDYGEIAPGSMPCVYEAHVTIIEPQFQVTSWGLPLRGDVIPEEVVGDPGSPFYNLLPIDEMVFDPQRNLYYAAAGGGANGRPFGVALLGAGKRLVLVQSGYYIREEVSRDIQYPDGTTGFRPAGDETAEADTLALITWVRERVGGQ